MSGFIPDPELEQLIAEVNTSEEIETAGTTGRPPVEEAPLLSAPLSMKLEQEDRLSLLLREMVRRSASDLHLVPGSAPALRVHGSLESLAMERVDSRELEELFIRRLDAAARQRFRTEGNVDFSLVLKGHTVAGDHTPSRWRLRINLQRQRGRIAAGIRLLPHRIPGLSELNLPENLRDLVLPERGLVIISGPTGSGKSTTLATLIDHLNRNQRRHIITIEDPVEYEHQSIQSLVEQVEIGSDSPTFSGALRATLRRDPDVILVGEMRDLETISTVLTAAETGHLILSTLHTADATRAVHRIIDVFPATQQDQIRHQLALALGAVVCQQLVPTVDRKSRVPALEILLGTLAVRNLIRKQQVHLLYNEMMAQPGGTMVQMEASLADLVFRGLIDRDEALVRANRVDEMERRLRRARP